MKNQNPAPSQNVKSMLTNLESTLNDYLVVKAPALPLGAKEAIVKYAPYISLVMIILFLPAILFALGLGALLSPFAFLGGVSYGVSFSLGTLFLLAGLVLEIMAIPGLFSRKLTAWRLMFYGVLLNAVSSLLSFNIGSLIIGTLLSLYILFQVKSYYK